MIRKQLPHYHTILEIADLLHQPQSLIRRMVHAKRCPEWIWLPRWPEPRFKIETLSEWARMLGNIDPDELSACPCQLERPAEVFRESRRGAPSTGPIWKAFLNAVRRGWPRGYGLRHR